MSTAPDEIVRLVRQFDEHRDVYRHGEYNETQLRRDFLDPLFAALGWDVHNEQGYAEAYRDVIHEDSLRVEKTVKAPDYCFRIGGVRKFFVEAKRPSVDVRHDATAAFQLRRYAWTAKLPLSILSDFEELAVYDCRIKPDKLDKASTARILLFNYTEYVDRWEEIAGIFSREAILHGAFDRFAQSTKKKRGTAEVDEAFLEEIETWREALARNLSLRNGDLSDRDLNFAVQRIIDRIIFLRMCEGRGIEHFGQLQALANGPHVYRRLVELFHRADEKYNSGLFHFQREKGREEPDELTTRLAVDDKTLKEILVRLYYPESPYEFAALPADILGQVYEQFLGKVIRLTAGHRAKIEEKPEVRKAGGVYYTPTYIVDYIVQNTVGKLVEGKTPQEVGGLTDAFKPSKTRRPLCVLDPACGSGSFLIVAYQFLLDWYLKQYGEHDDPEKHARGANPRVYELVRTNNPPSPSGRGVGGEGRGEGGGEGKPKPPLPPDLLTFARDLRKKSTDAEKLLWGLLRNRRLGGFKFRRQHPEPPYVLDFYCQEAKLAIELDGGQHNEPSGREKDQRRSTLLATRGIRLLRFWNHDVLGDTDTVLEAIWNALHGQTLTPNPSPEGRGGRTPIPNPSPEGRGGPIWRLTTSERKRILLSHIYGVDIDYQAVEVTKLSLLLKVLEGETEATLERQRRLFHKERALPDLADNIKCGNSLVGQDFYHDRQMSLLPEEDRLRINVFDWEAEFPHILPSPSGKGRGGDTTLPSPFGRGVGGEGGKAEGDHGFDAVIGNPPYVRIQTMRETAPNTIDYYKKRYVAASKGNYDIYVLFVERGLDLLNDAGRVGLILPHKFFNAQYGRALRQLITGKRHLAHVVHFTDEQVFTGATTYTCLMFLTKSANDFVHYVRVEDVDAWRKASKAHQADVQAADFTSDEWNVTVGPGAELFRRIAEMPVKLRDIANKIFQGLVTGADPVFILTDAGKGRYSSEATKATHYLEKELMHPVCKGSVNMRRYVVTALTKVILFPYDLVQGKASLIPPVVFARKYPHAWQYLRDNKAILESRERGKWRNARWYAFGRSQNLSEMEQKKIITPSIARFPSFTLDTEDHYYFVGSGGGGGGGYGIVLHHNCPLGYEYILGLLNSRLLDFCLRQIGSTFRGGYFAYNRQYIAQLPIRVIDFSDSTDRVQHARMVELVQQMLDLHRRLGAMKTAHDRTAIQRQIDATDGQIDRLVYELYGLTDEEIKVVEGAGT